MMLKSYRNSYDGDQTYEGSMIHEDSIATYPHKQDVNTLNIQSSNILTKNMNSPQSKVTPAMAVSPRNTSFNIVPGANIDFKIKQVTLPVAIKSRSRKRGASINQTFGGTGKGAGGTIPIKFKYKSKDEKDADKKEMSFQERMKHKKDMTFKE